MKFLTVLLATLAGFALATFASSLASAAPADHEYTTRAVRSPNSKDVFVRIVKVPNMRAPAGKRDCPMDTAHCAKPKANKPEAQG